MFYIEAFRADGSQVLGNLDGQACLRVKNYRRTNHYFNLKHGLAKRQPMKNIHHWNVVDESGNVLEKILNPGFEVVISADEKRAQRERKRRSKYCKWEGDDIYSYALFVDGRARYTGMSRSEAKWRRDGYVATGVL